MSDKPTAIAELISTLKQQRDELRVKIHLGSQEVRDQWDKLDDRFVRLKADYEPLTDAVGETAEDVWESMKLVGEEISDGFNRIRKSL